MKRLVLIIIILLNLNKSSAQGELLGEIIGVAWFKSCRSLMKNQNIE